MKSLKLDHDLAQQVLDGQKHSTWRLYDDKDIRVDDELELIDKVDPRKPEAWQVIGVARVEMIIEKRIGEVTQAELDVHKKFASREALIEGLRHYYGPQVDFETPVKMIYFTLTKAPKRPPAADVMPQLTVAKMYADGGSRGNPGPSASGFAIMNLDGQVLVKEGIYLGVTTNNQAEYQALKLGLEAAKKMSVQEIQVFMDSLLVVNQMKGIYKVKNRDLWPIYESIKQLATTFKSISFTHVPRELNKIADSAVNEALDAVAQR